MKMREVKVGMLMQARHSWFIGEITGLSTKGTVVVESYFTGARHYINLKRLVLVDIVIERDNGGFHASVPGIKGCHSYGDNEQETYQNIKDAVRTMVRSMKAQGELIQTNTNFLSIHKAGE